MSTVELEQAVQLHRAETQWLRQSAARLHAAHAAAAQAGDRREEDR